MGTENTSTHPKANGPMVRFFLGRSIRGASLGDDREQFVPVGINGHANYNLQMGKEHTVPREVYEQLMNSASRTVTVDVDKAQRDPRAQESIRQPNHLKTMTLQDYEVHLIEKEK